MAMAGERLKVPASRKSARFAPTQTILGKAMRASDEEVMRGIWIVEKRRSCMLEATTRAPSRYTNVWVSGSGTADISR